MPIKVNTKIELGWRVQDSISGFKGIATGFAKFLNGCERIAITPEGLNDGKALDSEYFDVQQLVVLDKKPKLHADPPKKAKEAAPPGGPKPAPTRNADPR